MQNKEETFTQIRVVEYTEKSLPESTSGAEAQKGDREHEHGSANRSHGAPHPERGEGWHLRPGLDDSGPTGMKLGTAEHSSVWPPGHEKYAPMRPEVMDADRERFKHEFGLDRDSSSQQ
jgi:hypothetical protein